MDKFVIKGEKRLTGEIAISGSKNATLPLVMASILSDDVSVIHNVPALADVKFMTLILEVLGAKPEWSGAVLRIDPSNCRDPIGRGR